MKAILLTSGISFLLSLVLVRTLITVLTKMGMKQIIRKEMPDSHQKKGRTPMMGGIGFFLSTLLVVAFTGGFANPKVKAVMIISGACFLIGLSDDLAKFLGKNTKGVSARYKLIVEIVLGLAIGYFMMKMESAPGMVLVPFGSGAMDLKNLFLPFVVFVFVGTLNSVNFTDGVDGLLSGCFLAVAAGLMLLISRSSDSSALPLLGAACGGVAAFLWFNSHPAAIFMGDSGSLFLGGILASTAIIARAEFFLAIAGLVFVTEAMSVVIQVVSFKTTGKRVFKMSPIHHHFELSGWSETQVSQRFWLLSAALSAVALALFL